MGASGSMGKARLGGGGGRGGSLGPRGADVGGGWGCVVGRMDRGGGLGGGGGRGRYQKREYSRCSTACSVPPTYRSTPPGLPPDPIQYSSASFDMNLHTISCIVGEGYHAVH